MVYASIYPALWGLKEHWLEALHLLWASGKPISVFLRHLAFTPACETIFSNEQCFQMQPAKCSLSAVTWCNDTHKTLTLCWFNVGPTSTMWPGIKHLFVYKVQLACSDSQWERQRLTQQTWHIGPMLDQCWADVVNGGPALGGSVI